MATIFTPKLCTVYWHHKRSQYVVQNKKKKKPHSHYMPTNLLLTVLREATGKELFSVLAIISMLC